MADLGPGRAFFVPPRPLKEHAKSYFTPSDQLQQHPVFHALQAPSSQETSAPVPSLPSSLLYDPCSSSHAACSSVCQETYHRHIHQQPSDHLYHRDVFTNHHVSPQLNCEPETHAKLKAEIVAHPLFERLLQAHVQCLSVGVSAQHLQDLETQLAKRESVIMKYLQQGKNMEDQSPAASLKPPGCRREIDSFMESYLQLLLSWRNYMEELVIPSTIKALSGLLEIEHAFCDLTGVCSNEISNGSIIASNEEWDDGCFDSELDLVDYDLEAQNSIDQYLYRHLQTELKSKLKDSYQETIQEMRKEIIRKRQAGKLPGDISPLKKWWNAHLKWPYPNEQEKRKLVQETGLEMRQVNNWFINHRKRNWPSDHRPHAPRLPPSSSNIAAASAGSSSLPQA